MQLFKSQCLQEQPRVAVRSYGDHGFRRRYGRRSPSAIDLAVAGNDDDADFAFNAEREILRLMADYDRAA